MGRRKHEIALGFLLATGIWATGSVLEPSHPNEKTSQVEIKKPDDIIAEYTELLAWFTGLLAFVSMVQGYFLFRADETARLNATAATKAADAATINANLLLATERPYLLIRGMSGRTLHFPARPLHERLNSRDLLRTIDTRCTIGNYGRNLALIRQISAQLRLSKDQSQITLSPVTAIPPVIAGGDTHAFDVPVGVPIDDETVRMIQNGQCSFWLHFSFNYRDIFGNEHITAGRWQYNFAGDNWAGDYEQVS